MKMKKCLFPIFLFLLITGLYAQTINNKIFFDSVAIDEMAKQVSSLKNLVAQILSPAIGRHITSYSFAVLSPLGLKGQMVANIVIHFLNSLLLYLFLSGIFDRSSSRMASLIFATNPVAIYAVAYLVERSQLLMFFFAVSQGIFYLKALRGKAWAAPLYFLASLLCFKLCAMSKEHGVVFLFLFPILSFLEFSHWKRSLVYGFLLLAVAIPLLKNIPHAVNLGFVPEYYQEIVSSSCDAFKDQSTIYVRSILTQSYLFFQYWLHWLNPFMATSIDMKVEFVKSIYSPTLFFFVLFVLLAAYGAINRKNRPLGCGLLMSACFFLTEFSRTRIGEIFVLYRSYSWALAYAFSLASVFSIFNVSRWPLWVRSSTLGLFSAFTLFRLAAFESEPKLWVQASDIIDLSIKEIACQAPRAFMNAGAGLLQDNKPESAIPYLKTASQLAPGWDAPFSNLGVAYLLSGKLGEAELVFTELYDTSKDLEIKTQSFEMLQRIYLIKKDLVKGVK